MSEFMGILPAAILMAALALQGDPEKEESPAWAACEPEETVFQRIPLCEFLSELPEIPQSEEPVKNKNNT